MNIHKPEHKLEKAIGKLKEDPDVPKLNKSLILDFADNLLAEDLSHSRVMKYVYTLKQSSKILKKDFTAITKKDAISFFKYINTNDNMMEWTRHDYKVLVKRFYLWLNDEHSKKSKELQSAIDYIGKQKVKRAKSREKTPEHMLTPDEILKIAENTNNSRDRAFVLAFYESMCRIGEIIPVKIKDCEHDEMGSKIFVTGKTGRRYVRLVVASPAIANWLTNHPDRDNPEAYLFCGIGRNNQKEMLSYASARNIIFEAAKKAGITKRVNLHKFRASRASELAKSVSESVLCKLGGWQQNSSQLREYVYLSGGDAEKEILRLNGLLKEEDQGNGFKMLICPRCNQKNTPKGRFCSSCSLPLDEKTVLNYDKQKEEATKLGMNIFNTPEFEDSMGNMFLKKLQEMEKKIQELENGKIT